jgi:hypothetical protein
MPNAIDILVKLAEREGPEVTLEALEASRERMAPVLGEIGITYEDALRIPFDDITDREEK